MDKKLREKLNILTDAAEPIFGYLSRLESWSSVVEHRKSLDVNIATLQDISVATLAYTNYPGSTNLLPLIKSPSTPVNPALEEHNPQNISYDQIIIHAF